MGLGVLATIETISHALSGSPDDLPPQAAQATSPPSPSGFESFQAVQILSIFALTQLALHDGDSEALSGAFEYFRNSVFAGDSNIYRSLADAIAP